MNYNLENLLISSLSIKTALSKIEANEVGAIFLENGERKIVGLATDGDKMWLISGLNLEESILLC